MLCIAYDFSLHMLAAIRGAHYFGLEPQHRAVRSVARAGVKGWWLGWWLMLLVWPVPVYMLPLLIRFLNGPAAEATAVAAAAAAGGAAVSNPRSYTARAAGTLGKVASGSFNQLLRPWRSLQDSGVSVTLLLALLAGHAVVLTLSETLFAHMVTKTPLVGGMDAPEGPQGQEDKV
jgi:hypothetical protein